MKDNNVEDWPLADAAVLDLREAQILRKIGRKRRKKGNRIARALALLWPKHEHHGRPE